MSKIRSVLQPPLQSPPLDQRVEGRDQHPRQHHAVVECDKLKTMNTVFTPIESEFTSAEQELAYEQWLREKVEASLVNADDPNSPRYSTDEVMRRMNAIVKAAQAKHAASRLA